MPPQIVQTFSGKTWTVHWYPEVTSTMDIARDLARQGCPHLTVVAAERQTKGRGRLDRAWHSEQGGLYFTVVVRVPMVPALSSRVGFCASLSLVKTIRRCFHIDAGVKWPNDILVSNKKLSGMLSEMEAQAGRVSYINIGIGVNVNNDPTGEQPNAVSLKTLVGKPVSRKYLLAEFLTEFDSRLTPETLEVVVSEWKAYTVTLNRYVRVLTGHDIFEGLAIDVDNDGALILQALDGSIQKIIYGDCFMQTPAR